MRSLPVLVFAVTLAAAALSPAPRAAPGEPVSAATYSPEQVAQGEALYHAAGCVGCHSPPGRAHLSGGRDNPTIFGTFYAPNISPHPIEGALQPDPTQSEPWNRGRYLVQAVGYCDQCHTPRGKAGFLKMRKYMGGGANPGKQEIHPNLTPDPEHGLAGWTAQDVADFLATGVDPEGVATREDWVMHEKVTDSYSWWPEADRLAVGVYVTSLEPVDFDPASFYAGW